jgi:glycine/D-amino acid oxidase-like deaminating enzyme/nitrite reductase/ring-hydroxylating ferredoxin subunit
MAPPPGKAASLWLEEEPRTSYPGLREPVKVDVAVLGAGIAGVTTALLLKRAGLTVAVVEAGRVGGGVTGHTTAKVSSAHGLKYASLRSNFGAEGAAAYAQANEAAIARIAAWVDEDGIACDFRRKPALTYAEAEGDLGEVEREVEAAVDAGLPATFVADAGLPWPTAGAIRFEDQAEFHPYRYLLALAAKIPGGGSHLFESTAAVGIERGRPTTVRTKRGDLQAEHVVVATHFPLLDRGLYFARMSAERSYCIAARADGEIPEGMYLSTESPAHSLRSHPAPDGGEYLLVGGESHKTGQGGSTADRYARLADWAGEHFAVRSVAFRWSTQDAMPADGMPFVGRYLPRSERLWVATGFQKWGMTNGTAAAQILTDAILGKDNPWAAAFDPSRLKARAAGPKLVKENLNVGLHFAADRAEDALTTRKAADLAPGEGAIVRAGLGQAAVYRDADGELHAVSPTCTHLGCHVVFNDGERSWDCPCHGSRFGVDGEVLQGPAVEPLAPKDLGER